MSNQYINLNQVCSFKLFRKSSVFGVEYKEIKRCQGFFNFIRGRASSIGWFYVHDTWNDHTLYKSADEPGFVKVLKDKKAYVDETDKKVYYYPFIAIRMSNSVEYERHFKTVEELEAWVATSKEQVPTIILL